MKRKRFAEEQLIGVLREQEEGAKVAALCRRHGISDATFSSWKARMGLSDRRACRGRACTIVAEWVSDDNEVRLHSSLGYITPAAFAAGLTATGPQLRNPTQLRREPAAHDAPIGVSETAETPIAIQ